MRLHQLKTMGFSSLEITRARITPPDKTFSKWLNIPFKHFENDHMGFILASCLSLLSSYSSIIITDEALMLHIRSVSVITAVSIPR